jgi:P-type Ca2+ transporter type 2C
MENPATLSASESTEGLSSAEARVRLAQEGYNELPSTETRSTLNIVLGTCREPMFWLLLVSVTIYLTLGDVREALILSLSLFVIFGITIFQERKTERALDALRDLSSPRALVIRDAEEMRIAGREVVRGDTIVVTEGDRVPADAVLIPCNDLSVDESLLTGESVPVRKIAWDHQEQANRPGGFTPERCWSKVRASPKYLPPACIARSAWRCKRSNRTKRSCRKGRF